MKKRPGSVILSGAGGEDARPYQEKQVRNALPFYNLSVECSDEHQAYIGYCRELVLYGGVCHDENRIAAYAKLVEVVEWHLEDEQSPRTKTASSRVRANLSSSRSIVHPAKSKILGKA
jgi:hypothetical protein